MATENENHEAEYDSAFDEASTDPENDAGGEGAAAGAAPAGDDDLGAEGNGEEGAGEEGAGEEGAGEEGAGEEGAGEEGAPAAQKPAAPEGKPGQAPAAEEPAAPAASAAEVDPAVVESVRQALIKQMQEQGQPAGSDTGEGQPAAEQAPKDWSKVTWNDYVPEDKREVVDKYREQWSEVHEAEEVIRNAQLQMVQEQIYSNLREALAPVFETTQRLQVNAHLDAVRQVHPDLDSIRDDLKSWAAEQPDFVRPAYEQVIKHGSAEQVIQLVNQYKQAKAVTGAVPEVPASSARTQQPAPAKPAKQPSDAAKKALAAAPSPSRTEIPGSSDPNNFDAAFEEAAGLG